MNESAIEKVKHTETEVRETERERKGERERERDREREREDKTFYIIKNVTRENNTKK